MNPLLPRDLSVDLGIPQIHVPQVNIPGVPIRRRRRNEIQQYSSPRQLQASAEMVGEAGLNTLSAIGNLLDVPASISRDLIWNAGQLIKPTDSANPMADMVNPFDQVYSSEKGLGALFGSDNRKEHRETFRHFGLASEEDTWANFGADLALDIATDPLTYMTFGGSAALKGGGVVAKKAGLLKHIGKKSIKYIDDAGEEVVEQLGKRRALQETTLKDLYKPASDTGEEVLDIFKEDIGKNVEEFTRIRDEAQAAFDKATGADKLELEDALDLAESNLLNAQQDYASRLAKGQDRLLEIEDARRIEDAAGFKRKDLLEKYGSEDAPEFKAAHQEFVQQLRGRMENGDLSGALGGTVGLVNPITGKALVMDDILPGAKLWAKSLDTTLGWLARTYPARFGRMLFDSKVSGNIDASAQELASRLHGIKDDAAGLAGEKAFAGKDSISANFRRMEKEFDDVIGADINALREAGGEKGVRVGEGYIRLRSNAQIAGSIFHHIRERASKVGLDEAFDEATSRLLPRDIPADKLAELRKVVQNSMEEYGETLSRLESRSYEEALATGIKGERLNTEALAHAARMTGADVRRINPETGRMLRTSGSSTAARDPEVANIPELFVSQMLSDPELQKLKGGNIDDLTDYILTTYGGKSGFLDSAYQPKGKKARAQRFAKWVEKNKHKPWFVDQLGKWVDTLSTESVMDNELLTSLENLKKVADDHLAMSQAAKSKTPGVGDKVQWVSGGVERWTDTKTIDRIQDGFAFFRGEKPGIPIDQLQKEVSESIRKLDTHWASEYKHLVAKIDKEASAIEMSHKLAHARDLAKYLRTYTTDSIYSLDRLKNSRAYLESNFNLARMGKGANEFIAANMQRSGELADGVAVKDALEKAGLDPDVASSYISGMTGIGVDDLDDFVIPSRQAGALTSIMKAHQSGEWQSSILEFADAITNTWKAGMTVATVKGVPLFPSFFTRNSISGQFVNVASGHIPLHKWPEYMKYVLKANHALKHKGLMDEQIQLALAHGVIGHAKGMDDAANLTHALPPTLGEYIKGVLGMDKNTRKMVNDLTDELLSDPSEIAKMVEKLPKGSKAREILASSAAWGGVLNANIEYSNRMPMFAWLLDNGWSPKAAADEVKRLQFDYSDLSPVEKNLFKRVMPFYTFSRKAAGLMVDTLARHPGGTLSRTVREAGKGSSTDATTPGYLKEQTSIDITQGLPFLEKFTALGDGTRRYVTSMGLPYEDVARLTPFNLKKLASGDIGGAMYEGGQEVARTIGSRLHPALTFGIEEMTGRDLFRDQPLAASARPVGDIMSGAINTVTGGDTRVRLPLWTERIASKSPFSRAIGVAKNVTKATESVRKQEEMPRHLTKLGSSLLPFRITDVSPEAQDYALRENVTSLLKDEGMARESIYTPHSLLDQLSPLERERALRSNAILQHLRRSAARGVPGSALINRGG